METIEDIILEEGWRGPLNQREWMCHPLCIIVTHQRDIKLFSYLGEISIEALKRTVEMQGRLIEAQYRYYCELKEQWEQEVEDAVEA